jgi:D-lactate dehydrogenase (cytochrome)
VRHVSAFAELRSLLGDRLVTDPEVRASHGADVSYHAPAPPDAVAFPASTDEVREIVRICARHAMPVVPYGAGTSVEGHVLATHGGLSLDMRRMDRVVALHAQDMDAEVQAGVTRSALNEAARGHGLFFAVDPGADATLGGMASTRASGTNAVRYGTMRDNVLGLEVVLADGSVIRTGGRARKSSAGYDLTRLFVGAEGTLGVITELTVRLHAVPQAVTAAVCPFEDLAGAVDAAVAVLRTGIDVARMELLDEAMLDAVRRYSSLDHPIAPTLFLEFHGSASGVEELARATETIARAHRGLGFRWAADPAERDRLWRARHDAYWAALALRPGAAGLTTDVCVPIASLAECILATRADLAALPAPSPLVGHVGDGNFHLLLLLDPASEAEKQAAQGIVRRLVERALACGGTCTGEHGIGLGKREYLVAEHGAAVEAMRSLKRALDPRGLMNPGKLFLDEPEP